MMKEDLKRINSQTDPWFLGYPETEEKDQGCATAMFQYLVTVINQVDQNLPSSGIHDGRGLRRAKLEDTSERRRGRCLPGAPPRSMTSPRIINPVDIK